MTFLLVLLVFGVLLASMGFLLMDHKGLLGSKRKILVSPTSGLSDVSKHLYERYMALPEDSRPFPDSTLVPLLRALDDKYQMDHLKTVRYYNGHHYSNLNGYAEYGPTKFYLFRWRENYDFPGYNDVHRAIDEVRRAIARRESLLLASKHESAGTEAQVKELTERLRTEARITNEVTKEFYS